MITALCLGMEASQAQQMADQVLVDKSESRLYLLKDSEIITSFRVRFGSNPKGHKQQQGDGRTPEGRYILDYKNINSAFYKSIHISYTNAQDRKSAWQRGVDPGGDIMIHGKRTSAGCLAMGDDAAEELFVLVAEVGKSNTTLIIAPTDFRSAAAPPPAV